MAKIRQLIESGMSQREIADELGVDAATINRDLRPPVADATPEVSDAKISNGSDAPPVADATPPDDEADADTPEPTEPIDEGMSQREIAKELGVTQACISKDLAIDNELSDPTPNLPEINGSGGEKDNSLSLSDDEADADTPEPTEPIDEGMSQRQAAKVLGVSPQTVSNDLTQSVQRLDTKTGSAETKARRASKADEAKAGSLLPLAFLG